MVRQQKETVNDLEYLTGSLARLWAAGINPDWNAFNSGKQRKRISLPTYCFEKNKYPAEVDPLRTLFAMPDGKRNTATGTALNDWIYFPVWSDTAPSNPHQPSEKRKYLFFSTETPLCRDLQTELTSHGHTVVRVIMGATYKKESPARYSIDPLRTGDMELLAEELAKDLFAITDMIYAWGMHADSSSLVTDQDNKEINLFYFTVVAAIRSFWTNDNDSVRRFTLLTDSLHPVIGNEDINYGQSLTIGLMNVLSQEYPCASRNIDINERDGAPFLARQLAEEIAGGPTERIVAFRYGKRWIQDYRKQIGPCTAAPGVIRNHGLYLMTGGLGNVGYTLARYLLEKYDIRLVLTGRTVLTLTDNAAGKADERIRRLRDLQAIRGQTTYYDCDVADTRKWKDTIAAIEEKMGTIHGVIHAAGETGQQDFELIEDNTLTGSLSVFIPKITGIENIYKVFKDKDPDFVWTTSSLASLLGGLGRSAYASANCYMDYFIGSLVRRFPKWRSVCLAELLFTDTPPEKNEAPARIGLRPAELGQLFEWSLTLNGQPVILESILDLPTRVNKAYSAQKLAPAEHEPTVPSVNRTPRPDLSTHYIAPVTATEKGLVNILEDFFGITEIGTQDDFLELGGDSLMAIMLLKKIRKTFGVDLMIKDFFARPTARQMAGEIEEMQFLLQKKDRQSKTII